MEKLKQLVKTYWVLLVLLAMTSVNVWLYTQINNRGSQRIIIQKDERLYGISWKDGELWYCTTPRDSSYKAQDYIFQEAGSENERYGKVYITEIR